MYVDPEAEKLNKVKSFYTEINNISSLISNISVVQGFPPPFESEFQHNFFKKNFFALRLILFFGLVLYSGFSLIDIYTLPDWPTIVTIRLLFISPPLIFILCLCFTRLYERFHQLLALLFAITMIVGLTTCAIYVPAHYKDIFYQSLSAVAFSLVVLTALQFRYTVFLCITIMIAFNISYYFSGMKETPYYFWGFLGNNFILAGVMIVCVAVSYYHEMSLRKEFLLNQLINFKNKLLEYVSRVDEITGLGNRHQLEEVISAEWNRALRYQYPLAVLFADFDYFKQYNDTYGHQAGDKALQSVGLAFSTCIKRAGDFVGRYGGDEFMVILTNTTLEDAIKVANNIMSHIEQLAIPHVNSTISDNITVTIGISVMVPTAKELQKNLVKQADLALQKGKNSKRNNIYVYTEDKIRMVEKETQKI